MIKGRLTEIILVAAALVLTAGLVAFSVCESSKVTQAQVVYKTEMTEKSQNTQEQTEDVQSDIFQDESDEESAGKSQSADIASAKTQTNRTAAVNGRNSTSKARATTARTTRAPKNSATKFSGVLNINTASADELTQLNGIGEVIAQRIVDYRNENGAFHSVEDIMNVKGIGEKKFAKIKSQICV